MLRVLMLQRPEFADRAAREFMTEGLLYIEDMAAEACEEEKHYGA